MKKMIKKDFKDLFKGTVVTFFHWGLVVLLSLVSFVLQYRFATPEGAPVTGGLFAAQLYKVNMPMFIFGVAVFLVGFYLMWKKLLLIDWIKLDGQDVIWKIAYVIIAIVALFAILLVGVLILFLNTGLGGVMSPKWTEFTAFAFPAYSLGVIVVDWFVNGKNR